MTVPPVSLCGSGWGVSVDRFLLYRAPPRLKMNILYIILLVLQVLGLDYRISYGLLVITVALHQLAEAELG